MKTHNKLALIGAVVAAASLTSCSTSTPLNDAMGDMGRAMWGAPNPTTGMVGYGYRPLAADGTRPGPTPTTSFKSFYNQ